MPPSKSAKVLRKSLTGSALLLAVAGLLFWTDRSAAGEPILYVTAALLLGAIFEVCRMGSLGTRDLFPALVIPAAWSVFVLMEGGKTPPALGFLYALCAALAAGSYAIGHAWRLPRSLARLAAYAFGGAVILTANDVARGSMFLGPLAAISIVVLALRPHGCAVSRSRSVSPCGSFRRSLRCGRSGVVVDERPGHVPRLREDRRHRGLLRRHRVREAPSVPEDQPREDGRRVRRVVRRGSRGRRDLRRERVDPGRPARGARRRRHREPRGAGRDLLESWVKRKAGVKDSSAVFGPSGGLLDQLDSILLAIPVALIVWPWLLRGPAH
jgi:hypothetical protein